MGPAKRFLVLVSFLSVAISPVSPLWATALDDYVAAPDPNYGYNRVGSSFDWSTLTNGHILHLTSQSWRDASQVDRVTWEHWVTVIVPHWLLGSTSDTALIYISDGNNTDPQPNVADIDPNLRLLSAGTRSVIVALYDVPNQPLVFSDEGTPRSEDEIIAYSWDKFLNGGDDWWPVQLPMVKSVVACMTAVKDFAGTSTGGSKTINHFVLTGGSKRGWTAWLTAAVDARVTAVAPIVSDLLNMKRSFAHHWAAYGFWADALQPYVDMGIFDWFDTERSTQLLDIVDPYEYRIDLTMPKFIINAAGDDFFVSDSVQFYIDDFSGETFLRHVPNTNHYLDNAWTDVFNSMAPYYYAFLTNEARPQFSWLTGPDDTITVTAITAPKAVNLWQATNTQTRDFRLVTIGPSWTSTPLADQGGGVYVGQVPQPASGWTAFFVELIYSNAFAQQQQDEQYDYHFTTQMLVTPEILPFEGDFSRDRITDTYDLGILSQFWLSTDVYRDISPRRGGDGVVNFGDFATFMQHWLESGAL